MSTVAELSMSEDLLNAFLATDYLVDIDEQRLCVKIGQAHNALDQALNQRRWAILTADNPNARQLDESNNRDRRKALSTEATLAGLEHFPSTHRAQGNSWGDEHGLLLLEPPDDWLHRQAIRFRQLGVVQGRPGQFAELWLYAPLAGRSQHPQVVQVNP